MIEVIKQNFPVLKGLKVAFQANKLTRLTFPQSMIAYYSQRSQNSLLSQSSRVRAMNSNDLCHKIHFNHIFPIHYHSILYLKGIRLC